jgi:hypothetical protein
MGGRPRRAGSSQCLRRSWPARSTARPLSGIRRGRRMLVPAMAAATVSHADMAAAQLFADG